MLWQDTNHQLCNKILPFFSINMGYVKSTNCDNSGNYCLNELCVTGTFHWGASQFLIRNYMVIMKMPFASYYLTLRKQFIKIISCLIKKKEIRFTFKIPLLCSKIIESLFKKTSNLRFFFHSCIYSTIKINHNLKP